MKVITHTITHQAKSAGGRIETIMYPANFPAVDIESIMYPANFAGGRSHLDLLLPSFLPSREEKKIQDRKNHPLGCRGVSHTPPKHLGRDEQKIQNRIFCPLRGHAVGRMQYAPTSCRQETLFPINSQEERIETEMQEQKNHPSGSSGILHTLHTDHVRIETKMQEQIFCPLRGHVVGRMPYAPTSCWQEMLFPINSREERTETKMQERRKQSIYNGAEWHTPHMDRVRTETKTQEQIFCPLRGHAVGRMQYAPTSCRQETLFPINSQEERTETKMQEQKNRPLGSRGVLHTPHMDRVRIETKKQERIFCPLRGHVVGRMQYAPTSYWQERLFPINSQEERIETKKQERIFYPLWGHVVGRMQYAPTDCRQERLYLINSREERIETEMQEQKNHPSGSRGVLHTPHMDRVRIEKKIQEQIFCPLRGHVVGRMQYAPTSYRQETLFPINSREERTKTKMQEQKSRPLGSRDVLHTPHTDRVRIETKMQEQIFCPLRGHAVGRMQYAPTSCQQETLFPINSQEERTETKMQEQKNHPSGSRGVLHTPSIHPERDERKSQERISCPLRGHVVGRMQYAPTSCRQEMLFPINSREERIETKMQEQKNHPLDSGAEWHTPFMRHGERDAVWREAFWEQRARVAIWRDRRLEERSSHARLQLRTFGENSKPYKSYLVALSEQLRDIFAAYLLQPSN